MGSDEDKANGITVMTVENPQNYTVTVTFYVTAGSAHENDNRRGVAHFIEHMLFNGTQTKTQSQIYEDISSLGENFCAMTSATCTLFRFTCLRDEVERYFELVSDVLQNPTFLQEEIDHEKKVIAQEKGVRESCYEGKDCIFDFVENHYKGEAENTNTLGSYDDISRMKQKDLQKFHKKFYCAQNMFIISSGAINIEETKTLTKKHFAGVRQGQKANEIGYKYIAPMSFLGEEQESKAFFVAFLFKVPNNVNHYAKMVLENILGTGLTSRLPHRLRGELGLAYTTKTEILCYKRDSFFVVDATTSEATLKEMVEEMCKIIKEIKSTNVLEKELEKAKKSLLLSVAVVFDDEHSITELLFDNYRTDEKPFCPQEEIAKIQSLTIDDIRKAANAIFNQQLSLYVDTKSAKMPTYQSICEALYED